MDFVMFVVSVTFFNFVICCDSFSKSKYLINFVYDFLIAIFNLSLKDGTKLCITFSSQQPTSAPRPVCINLRSSGIFHIFALCLIVTKIHEGKYTAFEM